MSYLGMWEFWINQKLWSYETFGPPSFRGPIGPLKHLQKEIEEVLQNPTDLEEYIDCQFLIFDAVHRAGFNYEQFKAALFKKLEKNKARTWPDWRTQNPLEPMEHDRTKDEK